MKKFLSVFLTAAILFGLVACAAPAGPAAPAANQPGGTAAEQTATSAPEGTTAPAEGVAQDFIFAVDTEPTGFDPHLQTAHASIRVNRNMFSRLTFLDADLNLQPELAQRWERGADNTYTFFLRDDVRFHNGRQMTADDVIFSYERIMDPDVGSVARAFFVDVERIERVDDLTVRFHLSGPSATFLDYTANHYAAIIPMEVIEQHGDLNLFPVGTGPFMLREHVQGNRVVLERNPYYFIPGEPQLDTITYVIMPDHSARLNAIRTGAVHLAANMQADVIPLVEDNPDVRIISYLTANYDFLGFNLDEGPWTDVRVRQAMSLLVDRQEIIDVIYNGHAVMTGPVVPAMRKWAVDVTQNEFYTPDVERARALLAEAGFPDGFDMVITGGITPRANNIGVLLQSHFARGGISAQLLILESAQYVAAWRARDHQTMVGGNGGGSDPDRGIGFFFETTGAANVWGYSNPEIDRLSQLGRVTTNEDERIAIYREAQEIILYELPNLFLTSPMEFVFARSNVVGYYPDTYRNEFFTGVSLR